MTLEEMGLNVGRLIAGFSGGVVAAVGLGVRSPSAVVSTVVAGTLTANYLGPGAVHYLGPWFGDFGSAFLVGLGGMGITRGVIALIEAKFKKAESTP